MKILITIGVIALVLFVVNQSPQIPFPQSYEVCNEKCERKYFSPIQSTKETTRLCNPNWIKDQAISECENIPINLLLGKTGTDKKYCSNAPYLSTDYVDNWWNAEGIIDDCEMPINSNMQFIFKMHDQSIRMHTGAIQIKINAINYDNDFKAMQVYSGEDKDNNNLPDEWKYCGNVDEIKGHSTKYILCNGTNLKFIKLVNAPWNRGNIYIDYVEVLKYG